MRGRQEILRRRQELLASFANMNVYVGERENHHAPTHDLKHEAMPTADADRAWRETGQGGAAKHHAGSVDHGRNVARGPENNVIVQMLRRQADVLESVNASSVTAPAQRTRTAACVFGICGALPTMRSSPIERNGVATKGPATIAYDP